MFPVGDSTRSRTFPYVNWVLIGTNVAAFLYLVLFLQGADQQQFFFDWGFVPACLGDFFGVNVDVPARAMAVCPDGDREPLQVFTSMFVHGGWAHIIGNMLFLWIFGDNVEDRVGHLRYLVFYFVCGTAAAVAQTALSLDTVIPSVGASGAISGVMGAYLVLYPTAVVQVVILPFFFLPFFVPAIAMIGIWFLTQLVYGIGELGRATVGSGVAWWAHVGGFIAGVVLIWFFKRPALRRWPGRSESRAL